MCRCAGVLGAASILTLLLTASRLKPVDVMPSIYAVMKILRLSHQSQSCRLKRGHGISTLKPLPESRETVITNVTSTMINYITLQLCQTTIAEAGSQAQRS